MKQLLCLLLFVLAGVAGAQQALLVNGVEVLGLRTDLVPNSSYIPAEAYATAIGAHYRFEPSSSQAVFELGPRIAAIRVYGTAEEALANRDALVVNGRAQDGYGGIAHNGVVYVPARFVQAFGFAVSLTTFENREVVMVVIQRAELRNSPEIEPREAYDRIVLEFSRLVPFHRLETSDDTVVFRFDRATTRQTHNLRGNFVRGGSVENNAGRVEVSLVRQPGTRYEFYTVERGSGFQIVIDVMPAREQAQQPLTRQPFIMIDPGHGGSDPGIVFPEYGSESTLTLHFARELERALTGRNVRVQLTRDGDTTLSNTARSSDAARADLFLSVHAADLPRGQVNIYYLGDASNIDSLNSAIRQNADATAGTLDTDSLRRQILLGLVPDLSFGETFARNLGRELGVVGNYGTNISSAPLYVLGGAAGRGILIEFSQHDLSTDDLPERLAEALVPLLRATY